MPRTIRDGQPPESELGPNEAPVGQSEGGHDGRSAESMALASGEVARIKVLVDKVNFLYAAGQTRRWHAMEYVIRDETIAAHTWNVVMWILLLHPEPSKNLIWAAMTHDVAEKVTGDMPRWTKEQVPGLYRLEAEVLQSKGLLTDLDPEDEEWLAAVDLFDAWLFLRQNLMAGNRLVMDSYTRATARLMSMTKPKEVHEVFNILRWEN